MEVAHGERAADLRRYMAARRAACDRRIAHGRERTAAAASAFRAAILSARSLAEGNVAHREKLHRLKDQLRGLEAGLAEAMSAQVKKGSECKHTSESISNATTTNEQLRSLVSDQRARRDEYANVISHQLEGEKLQSQSRSHSTINYKLHGIAWPLESKLNRQFEVLWSVLKDMKPK